MTSVAHVGRCCVLASLSLLQSSCDSKRGEEKAPIVLPESTAVTTPALAVTVATSSGLSSATTNFDELASAPSGSPTPEASTTPQGRATSSTPTSSIRASHHVESTAVSQPAPRASAAPSAVVAQPVQSAVQNGEGFRVYLTGTSPVRVGQTSTFTVVVEPQTPFKSNDKYPYRF